MTDVKAVAFHEAGHAVVALALGSKLLVVEIEPRLGRFC
jgi:ATP-dependent Zn protease